MAWGHEAEEERETLAELFWRIQPPLVEQCADGVPGPASS